MAKANRSLVGTALSSRRRFSADAQAGQYSSYRPLTPSFMKKKRRSLLKQSGAVTSRPTWLVGVRTSNWEKASRNWVDFSFWVRKGMSPAESTASCVRCSQGDPGRRSSMSRWRMTSCACLPIRGSSKMLEKSFGEDEFSSTNPSTGPSKTRKRKSNNRITRSASVCFSMTTF